MKPSMLHKLDQLSERLVEVGQLLVQEGVTNDMDTLTANSIVNTPSWNLWSRCITTISKRRATSSRRKKC